MIPLKLDRQKIIIIIGIVLAVAAVFMTKNYIDQQRQQVIDEARKKIAAIEQNTSKNEVRVVVANKDISRGAIITAENLEISVIPEQYRQPQAISSPDRALGMITVAPISKGEQVSLSKLVQARQLGGLAEGTPVGKRAITISVDNIASLGGMIKPGDYVDVIALLPVPVQTADGKQVNQIAVVPLFQNILVLAVGQNIGVTSGSGVVKNLKQEGEQKSENSPLITLALEPQDANLIAFVQEQGRLRLTLRSPADSQMQATQPASWDTLFRYLMPQKEAAKPEANPEAKKDMDATDYVEIYRGRNKEKIAISQ